MLYREQQRKGSGLTREAGEHAEAAPPNELQGDVGISRSTV